MSHLQKTKKLGVSRYIYLNELDKVCFQHDMAHEDFKDLDRRTASDEILCDKAFTIAKNTKYDRSQTALASMVYKFFEKNLQVVVLKIIKNENMPDQQLAEEWHKAIIRKFYKRKLQSPIIDNVWGADLADMQLASKFNKGFIFLSCVIDIYSKYAWVISLKDKKGTAITNVFQNLIENQTKYGMITEFYTSSMKS